MRRLLFLGALCLVTAFPASAAITGYVMNNDGQAIAGAKVETFALESAVAERTRLTSGSPERPPLATARSDGKGKFSVESPKDPVVVLWVTANGFAPASYRVERDEEAGALILSAAAMKSGTITANGKPVANARVIWSGGGEFIATTDAQGRYKVPDPAEWASGVVVLHPDYAPVEDFNGITGRAPRLARALAAAQSRESESADRTLNAGTALSGKVVGEDGKTAVAGAAILIDGWPAATTDADGAFKVAHAPARWELLTATSGSLAGTRARTGAKNSIVVKLARPATLSGSLRDQKTQAPVAGAELWLRQPMRFDPSQTSGAITDAKGNFAITGIIPGSYQLTATRPGYSVPAVSVSLTANQKLSKNLIAAQLARVSGSIVDEQKHPVAAARVSTQQISRGGGGMFNFMMMGTTPSAAASAPDGTFHVRAEGDTDIEIQAVKKGYPSAKSSKLRLAPGERKSGIVLTIPSGVAITGRVIDRNGKPVAGAEVQAMETTGGGGNNFGRRMIVNALRQRDDEQIKTAADGTFSTRVKEGTYDFGFKAGGFAPKSLRAVHVTSNSRPLEVTLDPGVEISGRVTRGGAGVEGVRVNVFGEGGTSSDMTGPDGTFRIADLSPGQFMLSAIKNDEFIQQIRPATAPATDVNIDIPAGGRITGHVADKTTRQPVTAFDAGVSTPRGGGGMTVMLPPAMRHFTNDDGSFVLENVPPGQTQVVVNAPGYTSTKLPNINVEDGKTIPDLEVDMDHGVRVTGHVTGPDGSALPGVSVRLDMTGGRIMNLAMQNNAAMTDANGDFTMDALEPGDKTFAFSLSGYQTTQKSVTLSDAETRVDAQLSSGTRVAGSVVTDAGVPVGDASVTAQSAADAGFGMRSTRTDASGNFEFEGLTPGRYTFRASKTGFADGRIADFDITLGAPPRIVMSSGGVIYGQVTGLSPDELQRATVNAQSPNGGASAPVDASGSYRIEGAPIGTVRVSANTGGGVTGGKSSPVQSVQLDSGSQVLVNITFKSDTVVSGSVTRNGQPVQGAMVSFVPRDATSQTRASTSTDSSGHYSVNGLDDATYNVVVVDIQRSAPYSTTYQVRGSGTFDVDMKAAALHGRVIDSDGNPVPEALVQLRAASDSGGLRMSRAAQTDPSGTFLVDNVPSGSYTVSAEKDGYGTRTVDTTVDDSGGNVEIQLAKNAGVTLTVVDARDGRLLNAQVHVTNAQNATVYDSPFFGGGSAGAIKLPLEAGSYAAEINAMGYAPRKVTIMSPSSPTIGMTPGGTIIVQSKGSALRRARLLMPDGTESSRGRFGGAIFTVDPSPGVTVLNNIAPGTYTLQILGDANDVVASALVTVMEGQQARVSL